MLAHQFWVLYDKKCDVLHGHKEVYAVPFDADMTIPTLYIRPYGFFI